MFSLTISLILSAVSSRYRKFDYYGCTVFIIFEVVSISNISIQKETYLSKAAAIYLYLLTVFIIMNTKKTQRGNYLTMNQNLEKTFTQLNI